MTGCELHRGSTSRWFLTAGAAAALLIGAVGCRVERVPRDGGANTPQANENRKFAETAALEAVQGGAREQVALHAELKKKNGFVKVEEKVMTFLGKEPAAVSVETKMPAGPKAPLNTPQSIITIPMRPDYSVRTPARKPSPVVISERVVTEIPYPTETEAETRALEDAQKVIEKRLRELDPPVEYLPPLPVVRNEYVRSGSRTVRLPNENEKNAIAQAGYAADRTYVEYTVEVTAEQVRELRTRNRVTDGFRGLGMLTAISLAGFLFLRLDEWSKGFLTSWLALAAAGLGGGIVAALVLV